MLNVMFRLLLTVNATSLLIIVYQVKSPFLFVHFERSHQCLFNGMLIFAPIALTGISILISKYLGEDYFKKGSIQSIEQASNSFLPSYLGYFFVALSIPNFNTLIFVYSTIFVFTFFSQALYFNPLFLIYGFNFYSAKTEEGTSIFLISRTEYRRPKEIEILSARRINGFTFLERG